MTASRSAWLIGVPTVVVVAAVAALILRFGAAHQSGDTIGGPDAEPPMEVTTPATRPVAIAAARMVASSSAVRPPGWR